MKNEKQSFEEVWDLIVKNEGETFYTKTGIPFSYIIQGKSIITTQTDWAITKKNFHHAFLMWPKNGPGEFNNIIRGPAYVWAILADTRIIKK